MADLITTGIKELDRALEKLAVPEANKISKRAVRKGLTVLATAERQAVDAASDFSPELRREMRQTIGQRLVTKGGPRVGAMAKAGFGVGQRPKSAAARAKRVAKIQAKMAARESAKAKGVGISVTNVHWFALGTRDRYQGARYSTARASKNHLVWNGKMQPKYVGKITPMPVIRKAGHTAGARCYATIESAIRQDLETTVNALRNG